MSAYSTLSLRRVMTSDAASRLSGRFAAPGAAVLTTPTVVMDAKSGDALFAYLPMPDVTELRHTVTHIEAWPANFITFGAGVDPTGHPVVMRYADQLVGLINAITPGCAQPGDVFYGLINRSNAHRYHRDGDAHPPQRESVPVGAPWAAIVYLRNNMDGGHLRIPEYDVTLACEDGWGVFFPSAELLHGVTPMEGLAPGAYRYSILYGTLPGARECFTGTAPTVDGWDVEYVQRLKSIGDRASFH